ncbi:GNAT family N-acetyltransferase [Corynebacterium sp. UMB9976]|uniref:GNAT family N-acetyltransferase n=1 Tax=Corynebacterium sp. UMB9976 TaxID=3046354 RepID=UPI00254E7EF6|nr:GNAT family N-acetyltransferase [Corynebacterium sp. UMB9976]MDK6302339.1 GNAT family N-acetyltransferase [Corynebacterium sp. UMB9976]
MRRVSPADIPQILELIQDLAEYEEEPDAVHATEESLHEHLFGENPAVFGHVVEVIDGDVADSSGAENGDVAPGEHPRLAGMALWFLNFSTWECTHGIYLEDLYVRPEYRKNGLGKLLLQQLAHVCVARGYQRMEWSVLKWNEPSIQFYKSFGAYPMSGWDTYRLDGDALRGFGA